MSNWTHIYTIIEVEDLNVERILQNNFIERIVDIIENAPKITGEEEDAYVDVIRFKKTVRCGNDDPDSNVNCALITITGGLRDRTLEQTTDEFNAFIKYIEVDCGMSVEIKPSGIHV